MPTFHKRTTKPGYCIRARPPEAGNVTYQITPQALDFLQNLGFTDGDDPGWKLIKTLRIVGDLYTHSEGSPDEVNREDIEPLGLDAFNGLSETTQEKLIEYLHNHHRLTEKMVREFPSEIQSQITPSSEGNSTTSNSGDGDTEVKDALDVLATLQSVPRDVSDALSNWYREDKYADHKGEFIADISEIPGYEQSVREFDNHPDEVLDFIGYPTALMYTVSMSGQPTEGYRTVIRDCRWESEETVGERDYELGIADADFYLSMLDTQRQYAVNHQILVTDGFLSWNVSTDVESLVASGIESESEAEHRILEEKAVLFDVICEFFEKFGDYSIERSLF